MIREFDFSRASVSDDRKVTVIFSSEEPVFRRDGNGDGYYEVLSHNQADVDLSRLTDGGPVLLEHDTNRQIGVVERAWLTTQDGRQVGKAIIRFSNNPLANDILRDVKDGIRTKVSFGYTQTRLVSSVRSADGRPTNRFAWTAHEISIVACPADNTVGVGRSVDPVLIETRSNPIFMANEYSKLLKTLRGEREENIPTTVDVFRSLIHRETIAAVEEENERMLESMKKLPNCGLGTGTNKFLSFRTLARDLQAGVFGQGGATIGDDKLPLAFPKVNITIADRCGANVFSGLTSAGFLPRFTTLPTPQSLTESQTGDDSGVDTDQLRHAPHRISASMIVTRQMELQNPGASKAAAQALLMALGVAVDRVFCFGAGGVEPMGIFNQNGIGKIVFGGAANWDKITSFETALTDKNIECKPETTFYVTSPKVKTKLKNVAKGATITQSIWENFAGVDYMNGYRALASNQMGGNNQVGLVDFSETALCVYGDGVELLYNPYTFDKEAKTRITAHIWVDALVSHTEAICISDDAGNQ